MDRYHHGKISGFGDHRELGSDLNASEREFSSDKSSVNSDDGSFEPLLNTMIEHNFKKKTFHKPTFCHYCSDMLWGLTNQGVQCTACSYVSHERCHQNVKIPCNQQQQLQIPVTHSFTILKEKEKRFCNACRLKIEDQNCLVCQVCPYYAHEECRPSVIHNCKSSACYHPNYTSLHTHHWSEGHLPVGAKCSVCTKSCSSQEALTGMRCSWCLTTVHSYCCKSMDSVCSFGSLQSMALPPQSVLKTNLDLWTSHLKNLTKLAEEATAAKEAEKSSDEPTVNGVSRIDAIRMLRVYEGPLDNPTSWKNITLTTSTTTEEVLAEALKKFHIKEETSKYHLTRAINKHTEVELEPDSRPLAYAKSNRPHIFLRHTNYDQKELEIKIYSHGFKSPHLSIDVTVNLSAPAEVIIKLAVNQFEIDGVSVTICFLD